MNRTELVSLYFSTIPTPQKKAWLAGYLPIALSVEETGQITIVLYADTYEEAHNLMWKHAPKGYALSFLRERN